MVCAEEAFELALRMGNGGKKREDQGTGRECVGGKGEGDDR